MKDDNNLHQQLNRPCVPEDLEGRIRDNWLEQKSNRPHKKTAKYLLVAASIFAIVTTTILFKPLVTSKDLISVAIDDINSDAKKNIGITLPIESLVKREHINLPPSSMPIEMTKLCNLSGDKTLHIKLAGATQGAVHLFIKKGEFHIPIGKSEKSASAAMPWKLIKPRYDLTVLVLYTKDMNPASVDKLIQTMFFA